MKKRNEWSDALDFNCKNIKLVICDWDGVITELGEYFINNLEGAARRCLLPTEPIRRIIEEIWIGESDGEYNLRGNIKAMWPYISKQETCKYIKAIENVEKENPYPLIKGSLKALEKLKKEGMHIALCTANNRRMLCRRLQHVGICNDMFDVISTPDAFSAGAGKPDPYALEYVLEKTRIAKEHALFIGDWTPDLFAARAANISFIAVTSGGMSKKAILKKGVPENHIFKNLYSFVQFFLKERKE